MLSLDEARARSAARVRRLGYEEIALAEADGRALALDVVADRPLPPFDNAAMDGFAARTADLPGALALAGEVAAGHPGEAALRPGQAVRIMTGAALPAGADCVVMKEDARELGATVRLPAATTGAHVRRAGEDVAIGERVLVAGDEIAPGEIGLLAALGRARVAVGRCPRVAIVPTGDELVPLGTEPGPGQLVESNGLALAALVREAAAVPVLRPIAPDRPEALTAALGAALADADVLVTSGGVSAGEHDHVRGALTALGVAIDFWKVAIRPGKPLVFGVAPGGQLVFGLPGNPVSSMVTFELFVRPALRALAGARTTERPRAEVTLDRAVPKQPGRAQVLRAVLTRSGTELVATPHAKQGSGMLSSMARVDGLVVLDAARADVRPGERASALLLRAV
jgi:molybdopterin molybdotransferase